LILKIPKKLLQINRFKLVELADLPAGRQARKVQKKLSFFARATNNL
jgi:hypothetical protein